MRRLLWLVLLLIGSVSCRAACTSFAVSVLTFGAYTGAAVAVTETITLTCSSGTVYQIGIGPNTGGTESARIMTNGSNTLSFGVFQDSAHTVRWGNIAGTDTENYTGTGSSQTLTIYGLIPAGQNVVPGSYSDQSLIYVVNGPNVEPAVSATVSPSCIVSATALAFGTYTAVQLDMTSSLTVTCTNTTPYYVNLANGLNQDSNYYPQMSGPGGTLIGYRLYQNAARTVEWRNTYNLDGQAGTGTGVAQPLTVYGRVFANGYGTPGAYADTETVTVTY